MSAVENGQLQEPTAAPITEKGVHETTDTTRDSSTSSTVAASQEDESFQMVNVKDALPVEGPVKKPFAHPEPQCKPSPPQPLSADQETKYTSLLEIVRGWETVPTTSAKNSPTEPITDDEKMWLTRECLLRYLRAVKWSSANDAAKRILTTLTWRREYGTNGFTADYISPENETGKLTLLGFDNDGRPCMYMDPGKQNTAKSDRQVQNLVFMLERAIDLMGPGVESIALLIDYKNTTSAKNPSAGQGKQVLNILQGQYPERNGRSLISDLPWYVTTFFKIISPFIDPVTKSKMKFNEPFANHIPSTQLMKSYGGDVDFEYEHSVYWPALNSMCDKIREERRARWEARGKKIGDSEWVLKGGDEKDIPQ